MNKYCVVERYEDYKLTLSIDYETLIADLKATDVDEKLHTYTIRDAYKRYEADEIDCNQLEDIILGEYQKYKDTYIKERQAKKDKMDQLMRLLLYLIVCGLALLTVYFIYVAFV